MRCFGSNAAGGRDRANRSFCEYGGQMSRKDWDMTERRLAKITTRCNNCKSRRGGWRLRTDAALGRTSRVPISGPVKIALLLRKSNQDSHQAAGTLGSNQNASYGQPCTSGQMQLVIAYQETFFFLCEAFRGLKVFAAQSAKSAHIPSRCLSKRSSTRSDCQICRVNRR